MNPKPMETHIKIPSLEIVVETVKKIEPLVGEKSEFCNVTAESGAVYTILHREKKEMIDGLSQPNAKMLVISEGGAYKLIYGPVDERFIQP